MFVIITVLFIACLFSCHLLIIDQHEQLLSNTIDLLPKLLLPLAGPEEFDDEDNEKLPIDLQYLGEDKTRERDPDIRKILLETLIQVDKYLL